MLALKLRTARADTYTHVTMHVNTNSLPPGPALFLTAPVGPRMHHNSVQLHGTVSPAPSSRQVCSNHHCAVPGAWQGPNSCGGSADRL